jgi:hypothetical protein
LAAVHKLRREQFEALAAMSRVHDSKGTALRERVTLMIEGWTNERLKRALKEQDDNQKAIVAKEVRVGL